VVTTLLLIRNIINISFSAKEPLVTATKDKTSKGTVFKKKNIMHYSTILERNPFGPPMKLQPLDISQETKKQNGSLSNLILVGTAVGPENMSYAIFIDKAGASPDAEEIFAYGEEVFDYGILTKVERSSAKLKQDAVIYTITMPDEDTRSEAEINQLRSKDRPQASSFARKVSERQYILNNRTIQEYLENPEQILTDAILLPNITDGRQAGFTITEVVSGGLYHSLGLRNGDILLRINGLELSNPEVAIQALSAFKGMNRVNLDIIRSSRNMSMNYQIQ
jgi:general secretion pathway protein C